MSQIVTDNTTIPKRDERRWKSENFTQHSAEVEQTTTTTPLHSRGRLFYCGWNSVPKLIFPEYDFQETIWKPNEVNSTRNDILVVGMYGPCLGVRRFFARGGPALIHDLFEGKVLYINGEAYGHLDPRVIDREYQIGPYSPESEFPENSRLVYFFALCLGMMNSQSDNSLNDLIFDPTQRPNNTGKYSGVAYYSSKCIRFRQRAASQISEIVPVYFGEGCQVQNAHDLHNYTNAINLVEKGGRNWLENHRFFHDFKYCLAMENTEKAGYVTEKLLNAFLAGCLPIYYGTREVFDVFNKDAFLFFDIQNPQGTLDKIRYLEAHPEAYSEILRAPILKHGSQTIDQFFSIFPQVGNGTLNFEVRRMMGLQTLHKRS
ncbi:glycosyltransferase family 10 fucosyltransferase [Nitzschia inconspicua]|uniref:Fucosyltransferase n=1 Tax=Nitzschia inconspicua TaxID=303405 RepID=A0A9K3LT37_9STRA|nr:glycosyltransferase family 10 fucosyltransferase [Nitzschia inconspicua]